MSSSTVQNEKPEFSSNPFFDALAARPMTLVWALLAVILIGVGVVAIMNQREARAASGNNMLYEAKKAMTDESKALVPAAVADGKKQDAAALDEKTEASLAAVEYKKLDVDAKFPNTVKKFKAVTEQYSGTRAGFEASMMLGTLYNNHGEPAKAITWFMNASSTARAHLDQVMSMASLGYALEGASKYSEAAESFQKAITLVSSDTTSMKADFMLSLARNQELMGDKTKARASYDLLITQSPNTEQARSAELLKAKL